ncbi:hypothetical protein [Roseiconus lacunae]|nr:hypothetical protein [Roseiconus lacunae]
MNLTSLLDSMTKELLEQYEATRKRYHEAQAECERFEKEIRQQRR